MSERRYGKRAGNPNGYFEDLHLCIVEVGHDVTQGSHGHQCSRLRGHGPNGDYCKQHAKMIKKGNPVYVPGEVAK
jgi:hypothetical protein